MSVQVITGDCLDVLRTLPDASVHTCVTSPPYWGLRDYGTAQWEGGDAECDHSPERRGGRFSSPVSAKQASNAGSGTASQRECPCGATRIDRQLGLESTPEAFVARLVGIFAEVRRVLRDDGTLWLNLGDSYASAPPGNTTKGVSARSTLHGVESDVYRETLSQSVQTKRNTVVGGLKPKDLCGIPWLVAFALRADGWYLRQDIIWSKPNPMPESVRDRCTKAHEYIFLLSKSERYFYDAVAIAEDMTGNAHARGSGVNPKCVEPGLGIKQNASWGEAVTELVASRNKRSVWTVTTKPYSGAHFATFPPDLIEPCILAGCPAQCCAKCGAPWERVVEIEPDTRTPYATVGTGAKADAAGRNDGNGFHKVLREDGRGGDLARKKQTTLGFFPTCDHGLESMTAGTVLDPFGGAGTTGLVADRLQRNAVLIELNPEYAQMARDRITGDAPLFAEVA